MFNTAFESPEIYVQSVDWVKRRAVAHLMTRADYVRTAFLDQRTKSTAQFELSLDDLLAAMAETNVPPKSPCYIFHIAFGGSTLLSRVFDEPGICLSYKEPQLFHRLAFSRRAEWTAPAGFDAAVYQDLVITLSSRTFSSSERPLIKPSDSCGNLVRPLLEADPSARAILLYSPIDVFAVSMLKHESRREYLRATVPRAKSDLRAATGVELEDIPLSDAEAAGLVWLSLLSQFQGYADDQNLSVRTLNSKDLFRAPLPTLEGIATFFGLDYPSGYLAHEVSDGAFSKDSKNTGRGYDAEAAALRKQQLKEELQPEIDDAKRWIEAHGGAGLLTSALERPVVG